MKKILISLILITISSLLFAEKISFSANKMSGQAGNNSTTTTLEGSAYVQTESMQIKADTLELSGDEYRNITASGSVDGKNLETNMEFTCDELIYDRVTKIAVLRGNVNLSDLDNDVKAAAQIIEYDQDKETAILQININLTQKDNVCSGAYAIYHKNEQLLEISGNAQVKQNDDVFRAQYITLDMNTQDITLGGNVRGTVVDSKESTETAAAQNAKEEAKSDSVETEEN